MVENFCEKIAENVDFVGDSNFIEEVLKQLFAGVLVKIHRDTTVAESFYSKFTGLQAVILLQQNSVTGGLSGQPLWNENILKINCYKNYFNYFKYLVKMNVKFFHILAESCFQSE